MSPAPLLLFAGERLSLAELTAARLDGDLVELGEGFLAADAPETVILRARSLAPILNPAMALTHSSAAWVHGALAEPPARHRLQRAVPWRPHHRWSRRFLYHDALLDPADVVTVGGALLTSTTRTVVDLLRRSAPGDCGVAQAFLDHDPALAAAAETWAREHPRYAGLQKLRSGLAAWRSAQDEVTR